jgi:hypothetical protein
MAQASMKRSLVGATYFMANADFDPTTGQTTVSYGPAKHLNSYKSGTRKYDLNPVGDNVEVWADGFKVYNENSNGGYELGLELLSLLDKDLLVDWLNYIRVSGGVAESADVAEMPYFGLAIYEQTSDGVGQTLWFPWVQANGRPSDSGKTAEGTSFDFEFPNFPLKATPNPEDKYVMYKLDGKDRLAVPPSGTQIPGVQLSAHYAELVEDDTLTLTAATAPSGQTITWSSGSTSVATVADGVITAEGEGNTIITASITVDGVTYTDTCTVIVTAKT